MTVRDAFNNILIELNKVQAPSLLIDDFIYLFNKGILEYINERYSLFETKLQLTDDLRVLLKSVQIDQYNASSQYTKPYFKWETTGTFGPNYTCYLPSDYMHLLNCTCAFINNASNKCQTDDAYIYLGANKLNANQWSHIVTNYYLKPSVRNPYYYIMNIDEPAGTGVSASDEAKKISSVQQRYGNSTWPVMLIKCGDTLTVNQLKFVYVDYLRAPQYYSITQAQLDAINDTTPVIEFPDYVIYEIINRIVTLIMENGSNQRLLTYNAANRSVA